MDPEPPSLFLQTTIDWPVVTGILALLVLLLISALISGSEVAFFSLSKTELDKASNDKSKKKNIVAAQLERPQKLLATILIGVTGSANNTNNGNKPKNTRKWAPKRAESQEEVPSLRAKISISTATA